LESCITGDNQLTNQPTNQPTQEEKGVVVVVYAKIVDLKLIYTYYSEVLRKIFGLQRQRR
jgi:hypothetical protein